MNLSKAVRVHASLCSLTCRHVVNLLREHVQKRVHVFRHLTFVCTSEIRGGIIKFSTEINFQNERCRTCSPSKFYFYFYSMIKCRAVQVVTMETTSVQKIMMLLIASKNNDLSDALTTSKGSI